MNFKADYPFFWIWLFLKIISEYCLSQKAPVLFYLSHYTRQSKFQVSHFQFTPRLCFFESLIYSIEENHYVLTGFFYYYLVVNLATTWPMVAWSLSFWFLVPLHVCHSELLAFQRGKIVFYRAGLIFCQFKLQQSTVKLWQSLNQYDCLLGKTGFSVKCWICLSNTMCPDLLCMTFSPNLVYSVSSKQVISGI